jgi:transposase
MRGVALVVAVTIVAEVGDFRRFANARQLMAYLGLTPGEHSSGSTIRRSGITKAGNALAPRVLIEGAWTYRMTARVSRKLHDRLEPLSATIRDMAWKAQVRLCTRYRRLRRRHCRRQDHGGESSQPVMSRSPDRCSSLE